MIYEKEPSDTWDWPDEIVNVSVPVSMMRHASGAMDMLVVDLIDDEEREQCVQRRVRFSAQAAAQFLDAIGRRGESGHLLLGDERPVTATLH